MKNAVIYVRVRTTLNPQEEIERQKALCLQFAKEKGLSIVDYYIDIEELGKPTHRVALSRMIDDCAISTWDTVIISDMDRLTRNIATYSRYCKKLEQHGRFLLIASSSDNELLQNIIEWNYEILREISERRMK